MEACEYSQVRELSPGRIDVGPVDIAVCYGDILVQGRGKQNDASSRRASRGSAADSKWDLRRLAGKKSPFLGGFIFPPWALVGLEFHRFPLLRASGFAGQSEKAIFHMGWLSGVKRSIPRSHFKSGNKNSQII